MDFSKSFQVSGDYKDHHQAPLQWESLQFADIVFVDKTHPEAHPLVYQLKDNKASIDEMLALCKSHPISFSREAFVLIGEGVMIDKKKKQILLGNKNTIAYEHLVVVSGTKPLQSFDDEELAAALQTLTDGLRVKSKIASSFISPARLKSTHIPSFRSFDSTSDKQKIAICRSHHNIDRVVHPYITGIKSKAISFGLSALSKRLYEVQL